MRRHPLPQVQIESQKTLNRLDAGNSAAADCRKPCTGRRPASADTACAEEKTLWAVMNVKLLRSAVHNINAEMFQRHAVPFTPGNGVLTPTQSNMAMLWYQAQPGTPMTPYQPSPVQYQAVPVSPGWQMVCATLITCCHHPSDSWHLHLPANPVLKPDSAECILC